MEPEESDRSGGRLDLVFDLAAGNRPVAQRAGLTIAESAPGLLRLVIRKLLAADAPACAADELSLVDVVHGRLSRRNVKTTYVRPGGPQ